MPNNVPEEWECDSCGEYMDFVDGNDIEAEFECACGERMFFYVDEFGNLYGDPAI